ncbi:MAG TPA: hypothetical protein VG145_01570 [Xanthobacteraceae bacterium]|jgi:hypothetical protein|nr:hypothetical protein [Xanthobacteraceae bacterium]
MSDRFAEARLGPQAKPPATARRRGALGLPPAAPMAGIVLAGALLAACSTGSDTSFSIFADPGKYQYYTCAQIAGEQKNWMQRQRDLKVLIDKADQSPGGAAVGFIAYKADYVAATEELEQIHSAARSKKCEGEETWGSNTVIR